MATPRVMPVAAPPPQQLYSKLRSPHHHHRRPRCRCLLSLVLLILGLATLTLYLVFRIQTPRLSLNSLRVARTRFDPPFSLNLTLTADLSIRNPNHAAFRFSNGTTTFRRSESVVGVAYSPSGEVGPTRTTRMNVTVDVMLDRVVAAGGMQGLLGGMEVTSETEVSGVVEVAGLYRRHLDVAVSCSFELGFWPLGTAEVKNQRCEARTK